MKLYRGDAEEHQPLWSEERGWYYDPPYDMDWPNRKLRRAYPPAVLERLRTKERKNPRWKKAWFAQPRKNEGPHDVRSTRVSGPFAFRIMWSYLVAEVPPPFWGLRYHHNNSKSSTWLGLNRSTPMPAAPPPPAPLSLLERSLADVRARREPHVIRPKADLYGPDGRLIRPGQLLPCGIWAP